MIVKPTKKPRSCRAQIGFSLVELMVASAISMLIMLAILTLYLNVSRTNDEMARTSSLVENGRFAINILQHDFMHAGFWGGYVPNFDDMTYEEAPSDYPAAVPSLCLGYGEAWDSEYKESLIATPVQVYSGVPDGCESLVVNKKANTAVVVVRHAETCAAGVGGCPQAPGELYFQMSMCDEDDEPYALSTISDDLNLRSRGCSGSAVSRKYVSSVYYVRNFTSAGDGLPALVRSRFGLSGGELKYQGAEPLIEGVEDLRVELGVDNRSKNNQAVNYAAAIAWADPLNKTTPTNRGDGVADEFVTCPAAGCTTEQLSNAVSAKIHVLVRSSQETVGYTDSKTYRLGGVELGPFNDGFKRHVFSSYVRFNNTSTRRETP